MPTSEEPKKSAKVRSSLGCRCIVEANEQLEKDGIVISQSFEFDFDKQTARMSPPAIKLEWIGSAKRNGKGLPALLCTYCPFCGKKYKA